MKSYTDDLLIRKPTDPFQTSVTCLSKKRVDRVINTVYKQYACYLSVQSRILNRKIAEYVLQKKFGLRIDDNFAIIILKGAWSRFQSSFFFYILMFTML